MSTDPTRITREAMALGALLLSLEAARGIRDLAQTMAPEDRDVEFKRELVEPFMAGVAAGQKEKGLGIEPVLRFCNGMLEATLLGERILVILAERTRS